MTDENIAGPSSSELPRGTRQNGGVTARAQQWQFTLKELRETLRDRRTIITLLAMPLLLYPLLGIGMRFLAVQQKPASAQAITLALRTSEEAEWLKDALLRADQLFASDAAPKRAGDEEGSTSTTATSTTAASSSQPEPKWFVPNDPTSFDLRECIDEANADVGVTVQTLEPTAPGRVPSTRVEILQRGGSNASQRAADYVQQRLRRLNLHATMQIIQRLDPKFELPLQESVELIDPGRGGRPTAILGLLPLILLLMTVTGGVYPAIDLTAGERERDTLETLMALPVPKYRLLLAKYVAVVTVTMLTGLMNLLAMTVTVFALQLEGTLFGGSGLTIGLAMRLLVTLTAFAGFFSAMLLLLTSTARSFKEAQALLIPLLLVSLAPGLVIMLPGWQLSHATSVVPVINMLLLARALFEGSAPLLPSVVAVVSTMLYASVALTFAARMFGTDAVAVGSRGRWVDLLARPAGRPTAVELRLAVTGLAALFPAYFVASGLASRESGGAMSMRLVMSAVITSVLFVGWPLVLMRWENVRLNSALAWRRPGLLVIAAAVLLGLSAWPWVFEMVVGLQSLGIGQLDDARRIEVAKLLAGWRDVPLPLVVLCLGIVPGVCEEFFFRGFLFGGLKNQLNATASIILSAIAFGLFHVILAGGAAPERVAPSTCMGLLLGWVRWRSGSLWPSMLLHVIHNSLLLTVAHYQEHLQGWGVGTVEAEHLPTAWLAGIAIVFAAGASLMVIATRERSPHRSDG